MRWLSILVVALALVAAGCGGSDDESSATTETTVEETLTDETSTDDSTTEATTETDISGLLGDEDCVALGSVGASIAAAFSGAADSGSQEDLDELASKVPDEIKADVQTLAAAFATYSEKIKDIGIEAGATPNAQQLQELQAAIASLDQKELTAASQRLDAWSKENCTG